MFLGKLYNISYFVYRTEIKVLPPGIFQQGSFMIFFVQNQRDLGISRYKFKFDTV